MLHLILVCLPVGCCFIHSQLFISVIDTLFIHIMYDIGCVCILCNFGISVKLLYFHTVYS